MALNSGVGFLHLHRSGFSLIEIIVAISLLSTFLISTITITHELYQSIRHRFIAFQTYQLAVLARQYSRTLNQPIRLQTTKTSLQLINKSTNLILAEQSTPLTFETNQFIEFNPYGQTSRSGRLTVAPLYGITLGIGPAPLYLKLNH